jgi:endonuclease/exonuclease/phosphatase family metal-dependent hydrolase
MTLKIVSLNLWHGGRLFREALEFLKSQDADIIALQEVHDGHGSNLAGRYRSMQVLREELDYAYDDFARAFMLSQPEGEIPFGSAILSRLPLEQNSVDFFVEPTRPYYRDVPEEWPILPRLLQGTKITAEGHEVNFFNIQGVWDLAGDNDSPARHRMVDTILKAAADKPNVIVTGDTNAKPTNPAMRRLEDPLMSVFGDGLKTTFNMRRKDNPGYATAAVDLMYISPHIKVLSKDVPDVDVSDHLPLVVTLRID